MTLAALWLWLRHGPQTPYTPVQGYRYRKGMQKPDGRYKAVPADKARLAAKRAVEASSADREQPKKPIRMVKGGRA